MKKVFIAIISVLFIFYCSGQVPIGSEELGNRSVKSGQLVQVFTPSMKVKTGAIQSTDASLAPNETIVGTTWHDLQSNSSLSGRIAFHPDGTIGAVWTYGVQSPTFPDRGTGYNYYDGSYWGPHPTARIEMTRAGWPSYDTWGPSGEINVSHNGVSGLEISIRSLRGSGSWTQMLFQGPAGIEDNPTWPRVLTSGPTHEYIHLIYNSFGLYQGQTGAMIYSRSNDGATTWNPHNVILPGTGASDYNEIGSDDYTMAAHGNTVAILCASAFYDLFVLKSTDNGDTWNKTIIWEHPYPFFDAYTTVTDTFFCVDNSASVAVGPDGKVHVVFGISRMLNDDPGSGIIYYPAIDGIGYWNEDMPVFSNDLDALAPPSLGYANSEMILDTNYIGWSQDIDGDGVLTFIGIQNYGEWGLSTMPTICVDELSRVFIAYASTTETFEASDVNYRKIWMRGKDGAGWGPFVHVSNDIIHIFDECIYPVLSQTSSNYDLHLLYQADIHPGLAVHGYHAFVENNIIHSAIPKTDLVPAVPNFSVTTAADPPEGGTTSGDGVYAMGGNATISATSSTNWDFVEWTENGTLVSTDSIYSFVVNNNRQFVANFIQVNGVVSTASVPPEGGTTGGDGLYSVGDWATVTASVNQDYIFDYWEEDSVIASTDSVFTFEVTGDHSLTANFHYMYYDVTTIADPMQGGYTSGDGTYLEGDLVTITASSNPNWFFESWTENDTVITTDSVYSFEIFDNRDFVAHYSGTEYSITTSAVPPEAGYTSGDGSYNYGFTATVSAFTNLNWTFSNWTEEDTVVSNENVYSFLVTHDRDLQANFFRDTCEILTEANPPEGGTTSGDGIYIQGEMVVLIANPADEYKLVSWTENDSVLSTSPEYVFFADHSCLIRANFDINTSLGEIDESDFIIFPNPANNYINITPGEEMFSLIDHIEIVNLHGKRLLKIPIENKVSIQIKVTGMQSGIYIIHFNSGDNILSARKVIILH